MIARLRGVVLEMDSGRVVVECGGVGYEVSVPESVLAHLPPYGEVDLWTRQIVREDDISLYGFASREQRKFFDMLREVKGCGAKISLSILSTLSEKEAGAAIVSQDAKTLARASGVGARLAERIILELKDKVQDFAVGAARPVTTKTKPDDELLEALMALGYRRGEVEPILEESRAEADQLEDQIKAALKRLMR